MTNANKIPGTKYTIDEKCIYNCHGVELKESKCGYYSLSINGKVRVGTFEFFKWCAVNNINPLDVTQPRVKHIAKLFKKPQQ